MSRIDKTIVCITAILAVPLSVMADDSMPAPAGGGSNFLFIMVAMIAIIYFVMIRPEQKRQKTHQKMLSELKKGDRVLTLGGIVGTITLVKDATYMIKSGEGILEFAKSSIQNLMPDIAKDNKEVKALSEEARDIDAEDKKAGGKFGKENR